MARRLIDSLNQIFHVSVRSKPKCSVLRGSILTTVALYLVLFAFGAWCKEILTLKDRNLEL